MTKFLSIPVGSLGNILVSADEIKLIKQATDVSTVITYNNGKTVTFTHITSVNTYNFRDIIQDAVVAILKDSWTNVVKDVVPAYAVSALVVA